MHKEMSSSWIQRFSSRKKSLLVCLKVPKARAVPFFVLCSLQKCKANLFSIFKTSKWFSRILLYASQPLKTSRMPCFLNFKLQKHQSYLFLAFFFDWLPYLSLILRFLNAKYMRCTLALQPLKTLLLLFFKHFNI